MTQAVLASKAASKLLAVTEEQRNQVLMTIAELLESRLTDILNQNNKDIQAGKNAGLSSAMIDRLTLSKSRIEDMAESVRSIAGQEPVVGLIESSTEIQDGLVIQKQRVPIGVLAMIFESRPNVVIDCSALAIKSGNAMLLKGGKEAAHSNKILHKIVSDACQGLLPENSIQLLEHRGDVSALLSQREYIDLVIPRGGEGLVSYVEANATMPVLAHHKGLCHMYIHKSANLHKATDLVLNAKVQRPGVCNALETLLLDKSLPESFCQSLFQSLIEAGVELRLDAGCPQIEGALVAKDSDWDEEYLDLVLSVKMVDDVSSACEHINKHGSQHSESILADDEDAITYFQYHVDASAVMVNASTRFNDGGQFQLGAELGISTTKLHAYGPMGAKEMTICRHLVVGDGHIRS